MSQSEALLCREHVCAPILPKAIQDAAVLRHAIHALKPLVCKLEERRTRQQRVRTSLQRNHGIVEQHKWMYQSFDDL